MVTQQTPFDQLRQNNSRNQRRYSQYSQYPQNQQTPQTLSPTEQTTYTHHNPYEEKFHSEFSFMSLVLGIFGLVLPLFSTLAVIFGIGGLMQTHREHMKGRWMAITGIILGFLGIILVLVAILFGVEFLQTYLLRFGGLETLMGKASNYVG